MIDTRVNGTKVFNMYYNFDQERGLLNNRYRTYNGFGGAENFTYDDQERLTNIDSSFSDEDRTQTYDSKGRITTNSNVGTYRYSGNNYQASKVNLNTTGKNYYKNHELQQITYNAVKKPVEIIEEGYGRVSFDYNPISMSRATSYYGSEAENKHDRPFIKHYSSIIPVEITEDTVKGTVKIVTFVGGDAYSAPIVHVKETGANAKDDFYYLHRDYLGSILAITDSSANIVEQRQFGAWGVTDKFLNSTGDTEFNHETSLLNRGYTGHEHFFGVALIHMNGRLYDAKLGRFLAPDNFVQSVFDTQSYNRYGYVLNNPLMYSDPSGELIVWAAVAIGAIIGATVGAATYAINAAITGDWSWGGFAMAVVGGAIMGGIAGAIAPNMMVTAINGAGFWATVGTNVASSLLPGISIPFGDYTFTISPSIMFGKAFGIGANIGISVKAGSFTMSAGFGVTFFGSAMGTGHKGWEYRASTSVGFDNGKFRASAYSTSFFGMGTDQTVGGAMVGGKDWSVRYENDGTPFQKIGLGDGGDSHRTAAVRVSYMDFSLNLNLFTGKRDLSGDPDKWTEYNHIDKYGAKHRWGHNNRYYVNEVGKKHRLGALSFGYRGYEVGINSERVRHLFQNVLIHGYLPGAHQAGFENTSWDVNGYFQYKSSNQYSLW